MRWFRRHIGLGGRLALFALAVQLALSFAHVHAVDAGRTQAAVAAAGAFGPAPAPKSDGPVDPGCAICGLIQLAATATPSAAPALPLPAASVDARLAVAGQRLLPAAPRLPFQARAPPVA